MKDKYPGYEFKREIKKRRETEKFTKFLTGVYNTIEIIGGESKL